ATGAKSGSDSSCTRWLSRSTTNRMSPKTARPLGRLNAPGVSPRAPTVRSGAPESPLNTVRRWVDLPVASSQVSPSPETQVITESSSSPGTSGEIQASATSADTGGTGGAADGREGGGNCGDVAQAASRRASALATMGLDIA